MYGATVTTRAKIRVSSTGVKMELEALDEGLAEMLHELGSFQIVNEPKFHSIGTSDVLIESVKGFVLVPKGVELTEASTQLGNDIVLPFVKNTTWSQAVTEVRLNGVLLPENGYTVSSNSIRIDQQMIPSEGDYTILISAEGYIDTEVVHHINL